MVLGKLDCELHICRTLIEQPVVPVQSKTMDAVNSVRYVGKGMSVDAQLDHVSHTVPRVDLHMLAIEVGKVSVAENGFGAFPLPRDMQARNCYDLAFHSNAKRKAAVELLCNSPPYAIVLGWVNTLLLSKCRTDLLQAKACENLGVDMFDGKVLCLLFNLVCPEACPNDAILEDDIDLRREM